MGDVAQKARRVRVTMIPEGQQLFADGVEVKVGDTFAEGAQVVGKRTVTLTEGAAVPPARAFGFAIMDDVRVGLALPEGAPPGFPVQPAPVAWWSYPGDVAASAAPAPLTEAELAEIEGREKMATPGPWAWSNDASRGAELRSGDDAILWSTMLYYDTTDIEGGAGDEAFIAAARSDVPRLLVDLRRAQKRIADLEALPTLDRCRCAAPHVVDGLIPACSLCGQPMTLYRLHVEAAGELAESEIAHCRARIDALVAQTEAARKRARPEAP